jgi:hypothetical protein
MKKKQARKPGKKALTITFGKTYCGPIGRGVGFPGVKGQGGGIINPKGIGA